MTDILSFKDKSEIHASDAEEYLRLAEARGEVRDIDRCIQQSIAHSNLALYFQKRQDEE